MAHIAENDKLTGSNYTGTLLINKTKKKEPLWGARCERGIPKLKFQRQNLGQALIKSTCGRVLQISHALALTSIAMTW
jgi:hypothetical protein